MYLKYRVTFPNGNNRVIEIDTRGFRDATPSVYMRYIRKELVLSGYVVEFLGGPYDIPRADSIHGDLTSVMFDLILIETNGVLCW